MSITGDKLDIISGKEEEEQKEYARNLNNHKKLYVFNPVIST